MRTVLLLPITVMVAVAAGCGSEGRETAARSVPGRDLTLQPPNAGVEVASAVELQSLRPQQYTARASSRRTHRPASASHSRPTQPKVVLAAVAPAPVLAVPASAPVASPAVASEPVNDRELPPGKTVTIIPASSGPSTVLDDTDEFPGVRGGTMVTRGGGTCRPRGRRPGIGIAGVPRPDFR
jgi:hypothetical protein